MNQKTQILLVEDEALIAMCLERLLNLSGFHVCSKVATGELAVEKAKECHPDVILMDIHLLGKMDGIEAAHQIRAKCDTPIIFMTGYAQDAVSERIKSLGISSFLSKPVGMDSLHPAIEAALLS